MEPAQVKERPERLTEVIGFRASPTEKVWLEHLVKTKRQIAGQKWSEGSLLRHLIRQEYMKGRKR